ncbi:MAG: type II toxin-antitoxin system Phd/YefM family antitoxin [Vicinamibacteria bacterium]
MKAANVRPITDLKNHTKELVQEIIDGSGPLLITQNGKPRIVVMDAAEHDRLSETMSMLKLLAHSQSTLNRTGRLHSSATVRARAMAVLAKAAKG